jgi:predicted AAA+ superfamily ATPase
MFTREITEKIKEKLFKGKVIVIYGARQVGKTTLVQTIAKEINKKTKYIDCDLLRNRVMLSVEDEIKLRQSIGDNIDVLIIDEAQRVPNIGLNLKILHTYFPSMQIIATGSSSFELANTINEPLTGRVLNFVLYPLSYKEISCKFGISETDALLETLLIYGSYPDITAHSGDEKRIILETLTENYLYNDVLELEHIRKPDVIVKILQLLALQIGSQVSFSEIGRQLHLTTPTVQKYITLLEKTFVIYQLRGFSRNLRKEISKSSKIYFWDLGIRNAMIQNFNPPSLRSDIGSMWENFVITERIKRNKYKEIFANYYFWRTYDGKEIDLIEEYDGTLICSECKWGSRKTPKLPKEFRESYAVDTYQIVTRENYQNFLL